MNQNHAPGGYPGVLGGGGGEPVLGGYPAPREYVLLVLFVGAVCPRARESIIPDYIQGSRFKDY